MIYLKKSIKLIKFVTTQRKWLMLIYVHPKNYKSSEEE